MVHQEGENYLKKELYKLIKTDESIFNFIQDNLFDGLWYWDLENPTNEWMNARFWETLGYDPELMPHHTDSWQNIINKSDLKTSQENLKKHLADPKHPYDQIVRYTHSNGSVVWVRCFGHAIRDKNGKAVRMLGAHQDITEQKMTEEIRKASRRYELSEKKVTSILSAIPDMIFIQDAEGVYLEYYSAGIEALYVEPSTILGRSMYDLLPDHITVPLSKVFKKVLKTGKIHSFDYWLTYPDKKRYFESRIILFNEDKLLSVIRDITKRKELEYQIIASRESAKRSEEKHRLLFDNMIQGVIYHDANGKIVFANQSAADILGLSMDELLGKTTFDPNWRSVGVDGKSLPGDQHPDRIAMETGKPVKNFIQRVFVPSINNYKWINVNAIPIFRDGEEKPWQVIVTFEDITRQKQAEKLEKQRENLEKKVLIAEKALDFKQKFLANMSHEIRTPLSGILGMADILSRTSLTPQQTDYLGTIIQSGENLRQIVNKVLDFSKIEGGKLKLKKTIFQLGEVLSKSEKYFKSICKKPIIFHYSCDPEIPEWIKADEGCITQIINNLVSNGVKFSDQGSITMVASVEDKHLNKNELTIKISVKDTGNGVVKSKQKNLLDPFFQVEDKDTRQVDGTGLGLSISKELAHLHGGELGFESKYRRGSTFWFTFIAQAATQPKTDTVKKPADDIQPAIPLNVLLAEDKIVNQKVISLLLKSEGHHVTIAENGEKVLELYKDGSFDLILMDIQMPVMDGIKATNRLRKKYTNLPPVIGLSANAFEGDKIKYMKQGLDEYLTKPLKMEEFRQVIAKFFSASDKDNN